ncbi:MAG: DUF167 domain-containing protein [Nitrospinae bacterium]|nr:DUF167 domain-containing protein [Nitrospinota bacterium]
MTGGPDGALVFCRVVASASKNAVAEFGDAAVKVRIAAPPVDGKANAELTKYFAKLLGLPKSSVQILRGEAAKNKKVAVLGMSREEVEARLKKAAK